MQRAVMGEGPDQTQTTWFRLLLAGQAVVAGAFGFIPFLVPDVAARLVGYTGNEPFIYRLLGASTLGYTAAAVLNLAKPHWYRARIPAWATLTFNAAAVVGALLSLSEGDPSWIVRFVAVAATAFTLITALVIYRDAGPALRSGRS